MKVNLLIVLSLLLSCEIMAQQQAPSFPYEEMERVSNEYFTAYNQIDAKKMTSLYADSMQYIDETYAGLGGSAAQVNGKEKLFTHFSEKMFAHTIKFDWREDKRFFSGNQGVFSGTLVIDYKGSIAGKSADLTFLWTVPYVVVLTFNDGKIIRQNDYLDYRASKWEEKK